MKRQLIVVALFGLVACVVGSLATAAYFTRPGAPAVQAQGPRPIPTAIDEPLTYPDGVQAQGVPVMTALPEPATFPDELQAQAQSPEEQMAALMNQARVSRGLPPLVINTYLTKAALVHSQDMADHNFCGHAGSNGDSAWDRIPQAGYTGSMGGEDVACGQTSVAQAFDGWKNSPGHFGIILGQYGEVGIAWVTKPGTDHVNYWTANFGGSPGKTTPGSNPQPILTNTPIPFLKTPTPQATATIPWWLVPTATPGFLIPSTATPLYLPTATPIPQSNFNGYQFQVWCDTAAGILVNCRLASWGPR